MDGARRRFLLIVVVINTLAVLLNSTAIVLGTALWPIPLAILTILNAACALISADAWGRGRGMSAQE